jgi:hypothetical protein
LPGSGVFRLPSGLALFLVSTTGISWRQPLPGTAGRGARRPSGSWYSSAAGGCPGGRLGTRAKELPSGKAASHAPASIRGPGRGSREWSFFAPPDGSSLHFGGLRRRLPAHCNSAPDVRYRRSALPSLVDLGRLVMALPIRDRARPDHLARLACVLAQPEPFPRRDSGRFTWLACRSRLGRLASSSGRCRIPGTR